MTRESSQSRYLRAERAQDLSGRETMKTRLADARAHNESDFAAR